MFNKRGQGMSTNTIILLVLGVVILVVLIVGFTMGWDKIAPWLSSDNVDTIVTQCGVACSTNAKWDFCSTDRELKSGAMKVKTNCNLFADLDALNPYGVASCNLNCDDYELCTDVEVMVDGELKKGIPGKTACVEPKQDVGDLVVDNANWPFCCLTL
jgi:hypothetical protein